MSASISVLKQKKLIIMQYNNYIIITNRYIITNEIIVYCRDMLMNDDIYLVVFVLNRKHQSMEKYNPKWKIDLNFSENMCFVKIMIIKCTI